MRKLAVQDLVGVSAVALLLLRPAPTLAIAADRSSEQPDARSVTSTALAANEIKTLEFVAVGTSYTVGQNFTPNDPWPAVLIKNYRERINYDSGSMRIELLREMGTTMPPGGGVPFTGELQQIQMVRGDYAWNEPVSDTPAQAGAAPATPCTIPEAGGTGWAGPAPESHLLCVLALWSTPHGFIKAAVANHATTKKLAGGTEVTFTFDGKYKMIGFINAHDQVERVRTWIGQSIVGDMLVETEYRGYKDFGGVQFPSRVLQKQDGFLSLDLTVASVTINQPVDITVPEEIRNAAPRPATSVTSQKLADGVFWLTGWTHHSFAVEMKDYIILVDTPNSEERALAVIAKTKELVPGKPIRYVVAMHHHWDHLGGIRAAIDEGAIIITHETNKTLLERAATAPHTIQPDRLSRSRKPLKIETVRSKRTLSDGTRVVTLYTMTRFDHAADLLLAYLPKEKILAEADAYSPPDTPATPLIAPKISYAAALRDNIRRLNLDVENIAPFHGNRIATMEEISRQAGVRGDEYRH